MNGFDWSLVGLYLATMIGLGYWWGRGYQNAEDYYLGSRQFSWWSAGISVLATQSSAISFVSIPAFVAIADGGGLVFLQYELAVPIAMLIIAWVLIPQLRAGRHVSIYEYLEDRYDRSIRKLVSGVFLLSRGLAAAVAIYATSIVLTVVLDWPIGWTILLIGSCTLLYDMLGGMRAVIYSDVIQMGVLVAGLVACIAFATLKAGGPHAVLDAFPQTRTAAISWTTGLGDGAPMPFWAFLFGGCFLYMAYYGTDQSQAQRLLATRSIGDSRRALMLNGYFRLPLVSLYVLFGVCLLAVLRNDPALAAEVQNGGTDTLVPHFIISSLPAGLRGLLVAALLAAAMSSIDSALNSLSAATIRDFLPARHESSLGVGRIVTTIWGVVMTAMAFGVGQISETVIEAVNQIGSAFYGPILAAFLLGLWCPLITSPGIWAGVVAGVALNVTLWVGFPAIHWMWWNVFGAACTTAAALAASLLAPPILAASGQRHSPEWRPVLLGLAAYAVAMFAALATLT